MKSSLIDWFYKRPTLSRNLDLKTNTPKETHMDNERKTLIRKSFTLPVLDQEMNTGYWFVVT